MDPIDREREAVLMLQAGEIAGLESLDALHRLAALRTAYALTGDLHTAEDCVSEAFMAVHDHIDRFDAERPFAPWFYRIVVNEARKSLRRGRRASETQVRIANASERPEGIGNPEREAEREETRRSVIHAVVQLPERQRAAAVLRYYLDMDERQIAQVLGCPLGTVKWRLHAARKHLRRELTLINEPEVRLASHKGETT